LAYSEKYEITTSNFGYILGLHYSYIFDNISFTAGLRYISDFDKSVVNISSGNDIDFIKRRSIVILVGNGYELRSLRPGRIDKSRHGSLIPMTP